MCESKDFLPFFNYGLPSWSFVFKSNERDLGAVAAAFKFFVLRRPKQIPI